MISFMLISLILLSIIMFIICFVMLYPKKAKEKMIQKEDSHENTFENSLIIAPNFKLPSINQKSYTLTDILDNGITLAFIDSQCGYCESYLEEFLIEMKGLNQNFAVICGESDKNQLNKIIDLYNENFVVLQGNAELFETFEISFLPSFIYIDKNRKILLRTPIPLQMKTFLTRSVV
ncbi:redoxin domain-containing protein [Heyndrickxia sp. FSL K6-6286]|uniref:peroxiredoxin family protein n=1 Tax=Heyndrickxia sp. FSL K6-6286 TaxID=2921510 RepID=UPI00315A5E0A